MINDGKTQRLRSDSAERALLHALGRLVVSELSANELLTRIVDTTRELLVADRATLYVIDHARGELVSVAAHLPEMPAIRLAIGDGIAGHVARTGELVRADACDKNQHFEPRVDRATGYVTRSMIAVPVHGGDGDRIGVLQVLNKHADGGFHDDDQATVEVLAHQVGLLLEEAALPAPWPGSGPGVGAGALGLRQQALANRDEVAEPGADAEIEDTYAQLVGRGRRMLRVLSEVEGAVQTDETVLLIGAAGTGKALIARTIHGSSGRTRQPLIAIDCAAHGQSLLELTLFGTERRIHGERVVRPGAAERARGGVLYLAEFMSLSSSSMQRLAQLADQRLLTRVGGSEAVPCDVRVIVGTRRSIAEVLQPGTLPPELAQQLRAHIIEVPPLARRGWADLRALVDSKLDGASRRHNRPRPRLTRDALGALLAWGWPGNVGELEACIEAAVSSCDDEIRIEHLTIPTVRSGRDPDAQVGPLLSDEPTLRELERRYIEWMLRRCHNNRSQVARKLGIGRNTLHRKLSEFGLDAPIEEPAAPVKARVRSGRSAAR